MALSRIGKREAITELNDDTYIIVGVSKRINELSKLLQITDQDFANVADLDS